MLPLLVTVTAPDDEKDPTPPDAAMMPSVAVMLLALVTITKPEEF